MSGLLEVMIHRMMLTNGLLKRAFHVGRRQLSCTMQLHCEFSICSSQQRKFNNCTAIYNHRSISTIVFLSIGKRILSLIALSLNLDAEFFENIGAFSCPSAFLRLLHYPGEVNESDDGNYGASAHSDYGMITLLATDGTPGLQICREKDRHPQYWEDVHHIDGALIVNIGDLLERWTNCIFRSTLHRVVAVGKERYSVAFFLDPNPNLVVQCLESCCSVACPPRFPPIKSGDYLKERLSVTYK
ncbi:hypothetical protein GUJ93_ZPchr0010g8968 [Zizania palustris]|uniref:Fe2OG dioxygenase domain-containing protein n=1 Tax=Zizania palustris TaxID=103762 RepID=A0A8J5TBT5_ZIZPA|nr:hypothetical protein GUJ93_ZPchr0010g8968 [Zizania palustris]